MATRLILLALLGGCATPGAAGPTGGDAPREAAPSLSPPPTTLQLPPARARPEERLEARFAVPALPPDAPVTRWQQFCWTGVEAWSQQHLNDAGAQGWELVSVTVGVTSSVVVPHTEFGGRTTSDVVPGGQVWVTCFKRPLIATPPSP